MDCNLRCSTFVLPTPSPRLKPSRPPSNLDFIRLRRFGGVVTRAYASDGKDSGNNASPGKVFAQEAIGAEYGEGFETFGMDGPLKMDVNFLNDKLQGCFLQRIRHAMKPDEAFGLIFSWDNVVVDTRNLKLDAWKQLAVEEGRDVPNEEHIQRMMLYSTADHVLQRVLFWETEESELERLKTRLLQLYYDNLSKLTEPMNGLKEWLDALSKAGIPCAVVSCLDRRNMMDSLERMGLKKYFQVFVAEEDGMESMAHRYLSAAIKLGTPMASRPWLRRRVHPFPLLRAADGSAFEKCKKCGVSVAVALSDMHVYECRARRRRKRPRDYDFHKCEKCGVVFEVELFVTHTFECGVLDQSNKEEKGKVDSGNEEKKLEVDSGDEKKKQKFDIEMQPRSAFRFFMESFENSCEIDDWLEVDRKGFQKWQEMSKEERLPFVMQANELDRSYQVMMEWEIRATPGVKFIRDLTSSENGDLGSDTHDSDWKDMYL